MASAKMICVVPRIVAVETEEPAAFPESILNDPQTREQFRSVYVTEDDEPAEEVPTPGFWRRQFNSTTTAAQKRFDWLFSVVLPVVCFAFDPFVFSGERALLGRSAPIAYGLSYAAVMATMLWLLMGNRLGWINSWISGVFAVSAVASLVIGLVLFPFSFIGMIFIIGFLGYTPLLMSFSLFRNAVRAYRAADAHA